ncbi:MAG: hypothetical protein AAGF77_08515 [Bacteroidota bacterium]
MQKTTFLLLLWATTYCVHAQFIKEKSIFAQVGFGLSTPYYSEADIVNDGFFLQGELVLSLSSWAELRPYAGFVSTNADDRDLDGNPTTERAIGTAFLIGGKARLRIPIPYVAPYIELGLGASLGKFETFTAFTDISRSGVLYHIPFALGLEIGKHRKVDIGFGFYSHPTVEQSLGSFAIGIGFPVNW